MLRKIFDKWKKPKMWKKPKIKHGKPHKKYGWTVYYPENFTLGKYTDIGYGSFLQAANGIVIEDYVQLGGAVFVYSVSTIDNKKGSVWIKKGARIGALTIIMPGVTIGKHAIVGAHSFVNKNVPDYGRVMGVPARSKAKRGEIEGEKSDSCGRFGSDRSGDCGSTQERGCCHTKP